MGLENRWDMALVVEEYSLKSLVLHQMVRKCQCFFEKIYGLDYIFILGLSSHVKQRVVVIVILVELLQITDRNIKIVKKACVISLGHL